MSAKPLRAVVEQLFGFHNRLVGVLSESAAKQRSSVAYLEANPDARPDFAQGEKWVGCKEQNLRQAVWDEEKAAEHAEFAMAARRMLDAALPDDAGYVDSFTGRRAIEELAKWKGGAK